MDANKLESLVRRLEAAVAKLEGHGGGAGGSSGAGDAEDSSLTSPAYLDYCSWVTEHIDTFVALSDELGDDIQKIGQLLKAATEAQKQFILVSTKHSKPSDADLQKVLEPQVKAITAVCDFRESSRRSKFFNHLSSVSEAVPALQWVVISPTPGPYVKDMKDAAMFYTNRVLKDYKEKDVKHVEWTKKLLQALTALQSYIKQHHTTGLVWNMKGSPAKVGSEKPKVAPKPRGGGPPPPPPPSAPGGPPPPPAPGAAPAPSAPAVDTSALFAAINKGGAITTGLKKVTSDMQTHKNPNLRNTSQINAQPKPYSAPKPAAPKPAAAKFAPKKKDPVLELDGKKWMVEHQEGNSGIELEGNMKQTVYIYKCLNSTIKINGKVNSITFDSCKKCAVLFDSSVAGLEVINSQSVKAQVLGSCPIINVDKTDGFQMYLSKDSIGAEIVTAKISEVNIMIPTGDNGDYIEKPVVEQFKTVWDAAKQVMVTEPVEIAA